MIIDLLKLDFNTAPWKTERHGKHLEAIIEIDKDNVAFLTMDDEAFRKLIELSKEKH